MVNSLKYPLTLDPSTVLTVTNSNIASAILTIEATIAIPSRIAGYVADLKYGQYKVLKVSTQFMIVLHFTILDFDIINSKYYRLQTLYINLLPINFHNRLFSWRSTIHYKYCTVWNRAT